MAPAKKTSMLEVVRAERRKRAREHAEERAAAAALLAAEEERRAAEQRARAAEEQRRAAEWRRRQAAKERRARAYAAHVAALPKWEYRVELLESGPPTAWQAPRRRGRALQERLSALGAEGWELVAYHPPPLPPPQRAAPAPDQFAVFKRAAFPEPEDLEPVDA